MPARDTQRHACILSDDITRPADTLQASQPTRFNEPLQCSRCNVPIGTLAPAVIVRDMTGRAAYAYHMRCVLTVDVLHALIAEPTDAT